MTDDTTSTFPERPDSQTEFAPANGSVVAIEAREEICVEAATPSTSLVEDDLPEIFRAFSESAERLQSTHVTLQNEVRRLKRELRDTNEQLLRSRELAALGQMAAGIAHEIRNPLGSVRLYASMLAEDLDDRPESRQIASKIEQAIIDLDGIVHDVLAFAREIRPRIESVDLNELVTQAVEMSAGALHDTSIEVIRVDLDAGESTTSIPLVSVDPALCNQALLNIIRNAIDAMEGSGTLEIAILRQLPGKTRDVMHGSSGSYLSSGADDGDEDRDADGEAPRPCIYLEIRDSGLGISDEVLERIFNPFFTTRSTGTGLGLPIAHRILDAHGGSISIFSREDKRGTCVRLGFPIAQFTEESSEVDQVSLLKGCDK